MLQTLLWLRMTCSSTFLKYLSAVLVQTPATYILLYCNASSTAFSAERCFQFRKKVLGFWATLYRSSDRTVQHLCLWPENAHERQLCEEFAPHPGGTNDNDTHVCEPICINMYCRANIIAELLARAKRAQSGAPWVTKCGKLPIRENLVITWPYTDHPPVRPHHRHTNVYSRTF